MLAGCSVAAWEDFKPAVWSAVYPFKGPMYEISGRVITQWPAECDYELLVCGCAVSAEDAIRSVCRPPQMVGALLAHAFVCRILPRAGGGSCCAADEKRIKLKSVVLGVKCEDFEV